jgi:hypothetical protein
VVASSHYTPFFFLTSQMLPSLNSGGGRHLVSHIDFNPVPRIIALQANLQMPSAQDYSIVVHLFYEYVCSHPNFHHLQIYSKWSSLSDVSGI